jgi:hypothetical protein
LIESSLPTTVLVLVLCLLGFATRLLGVLQDGNGVVQTKTISRSSRGGAGFVYI